MRSWRAKIALDRIGPLDRIGARSKPTWGEDIAPISLFLVGWIAGTAAVPLSCRRIRAYA
jgi:hypothetical protein